MASAREIQSRMQSIKDTMKITSAMYMISSSKMQKAKKSLADTEPFSLVSEMQWHVLCSAFGYQEYFLRKEGVAEDQKKRGYIVITADKGLAGAYNHNVLKLASEEIEKHPQSELFVVGELGRQYFMKRTFTLMVSSATQFRTRPFIVPVISDCR